MASELSNFAQVKLLSLEKNYAIYSKKWFEESRTCRPDLSELAESSARSTSRWPFSSCNPLCKSMLTVCLHEGLHLLIQHIFVLTSPLGLASAHPRIIRLGGWCPSKEKLLNSSLLLPL